MHIDFLKGFYLMNSVRGKGEINCKKNNLHVDFFLNSANKKSVSFKYFMNAIDNGWIIMCNQKCIKI